MGMTNSGESGYYMNSGSNGGNSSGAGTDDDSGARTPESPPAAAAGDEGAGALYDLVCIGFGPASLAIAIALHDAAYPAQVLFLERQSEFAWHSGMLLPGTRMQISFMKDLATLRNPRSEFTFVNYLHRKQRLVNFVNLSTFLPLREEYNDYMAWCAAHFTDAVRYGQEVVAVSPVEGRPVRCWDVSARSTSMGTITRWRARNVVVAVGGQPAFPTAIARELPHQRIIHSSRYSDAVPALLSESTKQYRIAVVGAGQSSAEIFNDLHSRYPAAKTSLYIRQHALKPSDDSPFVNEIFDPDRVDALHSLAHEVRAAAIHEDRATNYSVVRLSLIENLYNTLYHQRMQNPNESQWQHRIHPLQEVVGMERVSHGKIRLMLRNTRTGEQTDSEDVFDAVIFGTGYTRDVHHTILKPAVGLMKDGSCSIGRDYRIAFREGEVADESAIFLQGCCEATHGLSDSLLSILAVRAGELVDTISASKNRRFHDESRSQAR